MRDDNTSGRDEQGRWKKGHSPNPRGRPRNQPKMLADDVDSFKNEIVDVSVNGEMKKFTRHQVLLRSMYEQAIKGKSPKIAMELLESFEKCDEFRRQLFYTMTEMAKEISRQRQFGVPNNELLDEFSLHYFALGGTLP